MVILHVVAPAEFGGLERVVQMLGGGLRGLGHEVHVAAVLPAAAPGTGEPFLAPLTSAGVYTHRIAISPRAYRRERAAIAALCRAVRPDAVHSHGYRPDVVDAGVARQLGIPVVTTAHGFTGGPLRNRVYEYLQRRAFRRFDAVVAVSRSLTTDLTRAGVPQSRIHTVPNAWRRRASALDRATARRLLGLPPEGFVVGWVGRLSGEKGLDVLLDALPHLNKVPLTVSVMGAGVQQLSLQTRARELGVADRVRWHGIVPDADRVFSAFDVCVLSSRTEGTPMVLFEAIAAGVPVVATDVGGVPDVVSREEAVVVRPEDPDALAAGIRDVYEHAAAAARRAQGARVRLEREFGVGPWLDRYVDIYRFVTRRAATTAAA
jgi:glycosyltransferase involved in cell wall biosynthesis